MKTPELFFSAAAIGRRISELGEQISTDYRGRELILVCVLKGSMPFFVDLSRAITLPVVWDYIAVSSYGSGTKSSGRVKFVADLGESIEERDVLIVEDIVDTGRTAKYLKGVLGARNPASLRFVTLLDKPSRRVVKIDADYVGFEIPDRFVVGYGMDFDQKYRNLPWIGVLDGSEA